MFLQSPLAISYLSTVLTVLFCPTIEAELGCWALGILEVRTLDKGRGWVSQGISEAGDAGQGGFGLIFVLEMRVRCVDTAGLRCPCEVLCVLCSGEARGMS